MKKFTPILILLIIVGVVSVSGCIHYVDSKDNQSITDDLLNDGSSNVQITPNDTNNNKNIQEKDVEKINKSGNIKTANQSSSNNIKENRKDNPTNTMPKISKEEIENEIVRIMKLNDVNLNFTANATLTYFEEKPVYLVDVYDDYGWYGYFEVDGDNGPNGNDNEGYSFLGGAVRGETGTEATPIQGVMPKLSMNDARNIMDKELSDYNIENATYNISGYLNDSIPHYNISIEKFNETSQETNNIGTAYMNANTGEIIYLNISENNAQDKNSSEMSNNTNSSNSDEKVYSTSEAGNYVEMEYNGKKVTVREHYPYYSPENNMIFHSREEEAKWLSKDSRAE